MNVGIENFNLENNMLTQTISILGQRNTNQKLHIAMCNDGSIMKKFIVK